MYIETPRMVIRNFTLEDATDLQEIFGDEATMKNCEPAYDFEKTKKFLSSFCIGRNGAVAAVHKGSGKMIGYILLKEYEKSVYEMGWIFNRSFWRQGYAYESCRTVFTSSLNAYYSSAQHSKKQAQANIPKSHGFLLSQNIILSNYTLFKLILQVFLVNLHKFHIIPE